MESTTGPNPDAVREAAGAAASPDAETAALLVKHAAGEKLDARGYGKIGQFAKKSKSWLSGVFTGKGSRGAEPTLPPAPTGNEVRVVPVAPFETSPGGLAPVQVDAGVARRVAESLLTRGDAACVNWIERNAIKAGATGERLDRCRTAARLAPNDRALIVDLSPEVFAELGIDPRKSPLITVGAVLGIHALNLYQIVDELKELANERNGRAPKPVTGTDRTTSPPSAPGNGVIVTDPMTPPGAPQPVFAGGPS